MLDSTVGLDGELKNAIVASASAGEPLLPAMASRLEHWLGETWGERVDLEDCQRVPASWIASHFADDEDRDPALVLALSDDDLLREAQAAVHRIRFGDDEMELPGAIVLEIANATGSAWIVNVWGGGYVASQPPQEFRGPFSTQALADEALRDFGFSRPEDVTLASLQEIRTDVAEQIELYRNVTDRMSQSQ